MTGNCRTWNTDNKDYIYARPLPPDTSPRPLQSHVLRAINLKAYAETVILWQPAVVRMPVVLTTDFRSAVREKPSAEK